MPQFVWEPTELLNLLCAVPVVEELGISHRYVVEQGPLRLQLTIWQYDSDVEILLSVAPLSKPVVKYTMLDCPGVRVVNDKRGTFLEFAAANTFTGRYDGHSVIPHGLRLWVVPQIVLEPFVYRV
jgi:hypothetical protein